MMFPGIGLPIRIEVPPFALPAGQVKLDKVAGSNNCPVSKFRLEGPPEPQRLALTPVNVELRSPAFCAAVGMVAVAELPCICLRGSKFPKKKVLPLLMGPP